MTTDKIYVNEEGVLLYLKDCPVEPRNNFESDGLSATITPSTPFSKQREIWEAYKKALQSSIDSGVPFEDNHKAWEAIYFDNQFSGKPHVDQINKFYDIPQGMSVRIEGSNSCKYSKCDCVSYTECFDAKAILIQKPTEQPKSAEEILENNLRKWLKETYSIEGEFLKDNYKFMIDIMEEYATLRESSAHNLRQEVLKFVHHWEIYFQSPKVGQPPAIQDLKDAVERSINSHESSAQQRIKELEDQVNVMPTRKHQIVSEVVDLRKKIKELEEQVEYHGGLSLKNANAVREFQVKLSEAHNKAVQECIEKLSEYGHTQSMTIIENLKKR